MLTDTNHPYQTTLWPFLIFESIKYKGDLRPKPVTTGMECSSAGSLRKAELLSYTCLKNDFF